MDAEGRRRSTVPPVLVDAFMEKSSPAGPPGREDMAGVAAVNAVLVAWLVREGMSSSLSILSVGMDGGSSKACACGTDGGEAAGAPDDVASSSLSSSILLY